MPFSSFNTSDGATIFVTILIVADLQLFYLVLWLWFKLLSPIRTDSCAFLNPEMSYRGWFGGTLCNTHGNLHSYIMKYAVYTVFML
jgi:hypothetical protein